MKGSCVMKLLSPLLLVSLTGALSLDCCTKCHSIHDTTIRLWSTKESRENQAQVIIGKVCPTAQNQTSCENGLAGFWHKLAPELWPALLNYKSSFYPSSPHVEDWCWMEDELDQNWCTSCPHWMAYIKLGINNEKWDGIQKTMDILKGDWFCDGDKNPIHHFPPQDHDVEVCQNILTLILDPAIKAWFNSTQFNQTIPEICQDSCPPAPPTDTPTHTPPTDTPTHTPPTDTPTHVPTDAPTPTDDIGSSV